MCVNKGHEAKSANSHEKKNIIYSEKWNKVIIFVNISAEMK